jgi:hypothetical protein
LEQHSAATGTKLVLQAAWLLLQEVAAYAMAGVHMMMQAYPLQHQHKHKSIQPG